MPKNIPVIICMRDRLLRDGISNILKLEGYNVRASVASLDCALKLKIKPNREFILLYSGDQRHAIDDQCIVQIKNKFPRSFVVLLLENCQHEQRWQAEKLGVAGVLLQSISSEVFIASLRLVALGEHVFSVPISIGLDERSTVLVERESLLNGQILILPEREEETSAFRQLDSSSAARLPSQPRIARRSELSDRELEILACLVAGNSNKVIARLCNITEATVKAHLKAILRKTEVVNRTQAAVWALNNVDLNGRIPEARVGCDH